MSDSGGPLEGARVQRIDGPQRDLFVLTLHRADLHGCLVLSTARGRAGIGWVPTRPRGEPASSFVQLLRKHLENGRVLRATDDPTGAQIVIRRGDTQAALRLELDPPNLLLVLDGQLTATLHPRTPDAPYAAPPDTSTLDLARLEQRGMRLVEAPGQARARALERAIGRRRKQLERRLRAIEGDLARAEQVGALRDRASLLLAHLHAIPVGATEATLTDWNADPPAPLLVTLDPALGPKGEAEALFRRARKHERGAEIALSRHAETEQELARCDALAEALVGADETALDRIEREAARHGVRSQRAGAAAEASARMPYRTFRGAGDRAILVGRSAADNDVLTVRVARPHDHWLHVRGFGGSHVVVPLERGESCPPELLVDAAHLAAHFSEARGETRIEVQHVARRHVRKRRGAPPGAVVVTREKVIVLRIESERIRTLLGAEDPR